ncbi:ATP-dependent Clp protease ATP-binding subunit ClpX [Novimethylophilus kurashikiensis]|uniref:ATP-dependent Clp protease ATP-binding subunit ClpX n=1 Tax=Novimethylophilus kurashikiensis TaxID=1825523 RepID=A0A2R5F9B2_9PROT|nr:hypothetical protein [Novimethylophilus kurashikiensis]GBG14816.1 ATP-dependent Clp protease ATP-binding subunit ClpX [Novimethylophilus kurashikiensis]
MQKLKSPNLLLVAFLSISTLVFSASSFAGPSAQVGEIAQSPYRLQSWEQRRLRTREQMTGVLAHDAAAGTAFDKTLTASERWQLTPMETMELLGAFYMPREGIESGLPVILTAAMLGWYDALRYGSASGRDEIQTNAKFFLLPFSTSGKTGVEQLIAYLKDHPDQAKKSAILAESMFVKLKDGLTYDHRWPTAYGMERFQCGMTLDCKIPSPLPRDKWPEAEAAAKAFVFKYYHIPQ